jgi:hypothetical protein
MQGEETFAHYESVRPVMVPKPLSSPTTTTTSTDATPLCSPSDTALPLSSYNCDPLNLLQTARPNLSHEELHTFLEQSRASLDATFSAMINRDRERSSSASSTSRRSSSSKRSREEDDDDTVDTERKTKRALRRISLRNKAITSVRATMPANREKGTEIMFRVRIDTPPSTPTQAELPGKAGVVEEKKKKSEVEDGKEGNGEKKSDSNESEEPEKEKEAGEKPAVASKPQRGRGRMKSRAKNA